MSVEGWGLGVDTRLGGAVSDVSEPVGCRAPGCAHRGHDPAAPIRRWLAPCAVRLLAVDSYPDMRVRWYALADGGLARLTEPGHHHARLEPVDPRWAPLHVRAELAGKRGTGTLR
ncbi:MAG: hypothetical protein KatS3mg014_2519 [Actinomycetota bacterium]|nr:MAG: hypothetical protein KatS3mg014_2486 [Actinomycetota bacterium]GIV00904.1 MAG: hypothetical protein KatS3mg014_2519 [Actinomycetota bacterium]